MLPSSAIRVGRHGLRVEEGVLGGLEFSSAMDLIRINQGSFLRRKKGMMGAGSKADSCGCRGTREESTGIMGDNKCKNTVWFNRWGELYHVLYSTSMFCAGAWNRSQEVNQVK